MIGAGEGNRTLVFSLEGCCSTIELHPRSAINYHAGQTASTAPALIWEGKRDRFRKKRRRTPLNIARIRAYTDTTINTTKGGDPVSLTKRCHLAGIAR